MNTKSLRYRVEAALLKLPLWFFRPMGLDRASAFAGWMARHVGPRLGVTRRARANLAMALPELSPAARERIVERMWENLGRTIAEYAFLEKFSEPAYRDRLEIVGLDLVEPIRAEGKGAIFASGHFANWELMPLPLKLLGIEGGEVYRHANNPVVNEWMVDLRKRAIVENQIAKGAQGAREIVRLLKKNAFIGMLVDQKMNDGIEARLLGLPSMTTSAPAALAVRYGAALVPASMERLDGARFRLTFYPPLKVDRTAEPLDEIARLTQLLNDFLGEQIRARPHEWLWLHNRWTRSNKD